MNSIISAALVTMKWKVTQMTREVFMRSQALSPTTAKGSTKSWRKGNERKWRRSGILWMAVFTQLKRKNFTTGRWLCEWSSIALPVLPKAKLGCWASMFAA